MLLYHIFKQWISQMVLESCCHIGAAPLREELFIAADDCCVELRVLICCCCCDLDRAVCGCKIAPGRAAGLLTAVAGAGGAPRMSRLKAPPLLYVSIHSSATMRGC